MWEENFVRCVFLGFVKRSKDSFIRFIVKSVTNDQMKTFFPEIEKLSGGIFMFGIKKFQQAENIF